MFVSLFKQVKTNKMETTTENRKKINHGKNIRIARTCQNITQEDVAIRTNLSQSKISALELEETIDDKTLDIFAAALNIPVGFLKNFQPEELMKSYTITDTENTFNNGAENSKDTINQQVQGEQENNTTNNYNYPLDELKELYERLLQEKDKQIEELKSRKN